MPMSSLDGRRVTTFDAYLAAEDRPATLEVRPDSPVDAVLVEPAARSGVRLADGSTIGAGTVILSAGTYGSPPILLRSGIGPAAELRELGITVVADLPGVGANLADHPGVGLDSGYRGEGTAGPVLHTIATWRSARLGAGRAARPDVLDRGPGCRRIPGSPSTRPAQAGLARLGAAAIGRSARPAADHAA